MSGPQQVAEKLHDGLDAEQPLVKRHKELGQHGQPPEETHSPIRPRATVMAATVSVVVVVFLFVEFD